MYNRYSKFDPAVLQKLRKKNIIQDLSEPPTRDELKEAIKKMNALATPGESGLSPTAMKNLSKEHEAEWMPTRSGTSLLSPGGSTRERGRTVIQTTIEAYAYKMLLRDTYLPFSARDS